MTLEQLTIGTRLRLGFALMVVLLVMVSVLGITRMAQNQQRIEAIAKVNNLKLKLATAMRDTVYERMVSLRNLALARDFPSMQADMEHLRQQHEKYVGAQEQLFSLFAQSQNVSNQEKELLDLIATFSASALPVIGRAAKLAMAMQIDQAYTVLTSELSPVQRQWMEALGELMPKASPQET